MKTATKGVWDVKSSLVTIRDVIGPAVTLANNVVIRIESIVSGYGVPTAALTTIATQLSAIKNPITKQYVVNCGVMKYLSLTIGSQIYQIPAFNYIINNGVTCTLNFFESNDWILGQSFLSLYDTVYDINGRNIGFA